MKNDNLPRDARDTRDGRGASVTAVTSVTSETEGKRNMPADAMNIERFLKLKEVQDRFGVSRSTVWRWHAERGLRVVSVGGVTRIRESDLQAFIERHMKTAGN